MRVTQYEGERRGEPRHYISIINLLSEMAENSPRFPSTFRTYIVMPGGGRFKVSHFKSYGSSGPRKAVLDDEYSGAQYEWSADHSVSSSDTRRVLSISFDKKDLTLEIRVT